jgi:hypothetical protein
VDRTHLDCAALIGRIRARAAGGHPDEIAEVAAEAEALASTHQFRDHLAALRLTQADLAWRSQLPAGPSGFDPAQGFYREALVFALRFNRYLLDESLAGRLAGTPLPSVISRCAQQGAEGERMVRSLRDWWAEGTNALDGDGPESISPLRQGVALVEAERSARAREPGPPGSPRAAQPTVLDQLDAAIP